MIKFVSIDVGLPKLGQRVLVATADGYTTFAKRVKWVLPMGEHWIDDNSIPLAGTVTHYAVVVAPSETPE